MAQEFLKENSAELTESPEPIASSSRPLTSESKESIHPGQRPSLVNVPVTPRIHQGEYVSEPSRAVSSYFVPDFSNPREAVAQSPSDAASGAKSSHEILRRMSLSSSAKRQDSLHEVDPRAANPSLGLSGGVISATFCIPHSLQYRKGADWVSIYHIYPLYSSDL